MTALQWPSLPGVERLREPVHVGAQGNAGPTASPPQMLTVTVTVCKSLLSAPLCTVSRSSLEWVFPSPVYKRGNQGSEKSCSLTEVTQPVRGGASAGTRAVPPGACVLSHRAVRLRRESVLQAGVTVDYMLRCLNRPVTV